MSHHGREGLTEEPDGPELLNRSAIQLIKDIANAGENPTRGCGLAPHVLCDRWLEQNGLECKASRKRQRDRRAEELDALIAKLRAEREAL